MLKAELTPVAVSLAPFFRTHRNDFACLLDRWRFPPSVRVCHSQIGRRPRGVSTHFRPFIRFVVSEKRPMLCRVAFGVVAFGLLISLSPSASAQQPAAPPGGVIMKLDGKVTQVVGQGLLVQGNDGKQYAVGFTPASKLTVSGTASPEFLGPGMFIQLDTELDDKGQPVGEVTKLQIVEQSKINEPGIFSEAGPDGKPGAAGKYFIRGLVKTNKTNMLGVQAGGRLMTFKVSAAAAMPVTVSDWTLASPGDSIQGDGKSYAQQGAPATAATPVWCERMEIKAVAPIVKKKKGRK